MKFILVATACILLVTAVASTSAHSIHRLASPINDPCGRYTNCATCITSHLGCGWCFSNTTWASGEPGPQCAGTQAHQHAQFVCPSTYTTKSCEAYECNPATGTCDMNNQGHGSPSKSVCEHNCSVNTHQFVCDNETHTCKQVPQGTPGSTSLLVCQQECSLTHTATATGSPASHHPSPPPTTTPLYKCDYSDGQCVLAPPGQGASKQVCEQGCKKGNESYICNTYPTPHCSITKAHGGMSKKQCDAECNPTMAPNPPPSMVGLFRGLSIGNNYVEGIHYLNIQETTATYVIMKADRVNSWFKGTPEHTPPSPGEPHEQLNIKITSSSDSSQVGKVWNSIADTNGQNGQVSSFITLAYAAAGSPAPQHVTAAFSGSGDTVLALAKCLPGTHCAWVMPSIKKSPEPPALLLRGLSGGGAISDPCSQAGAASCKTCLGLNPSWNCGWCGGGDVSYILPNNQKMTGTQCASESSKTPWTCSNSYNTLHCPTLYQCVNGNTSQAQCVKSTNSTGVPLAQCEENCQHPITTPAPVEQYVCNITAKKCFKCLNTSCSGSMPAAQCAAACTHPKPGPGPHSLQGTWRGFAVQVGYTDYEMDLFFTNTTVTVFKSGKQLFEANVIHLGGDAMIWTYTSGHLKGLKSSIFFQQAQEAPNNSFISITAGESKPNGPMPQSVFPAMTTPGMKAYIFYKCLADPCKFRKP